MVLKVGLHCEGCVAKVNWLGFSTLAFSGRLVKENDGSASRGLSLTNSSGIGLL